MFLTVTLLGSVSVYEINHSRVWEIISQNKTVAKISIKIFFGYD